MQTAYPLQISEEAMRSELRRTIQAICSDSDTPDTDAVKRAERTACAESLPVERYAVALRGIAQDVPADAITREMYVTTVDVAFRWLSERDRMERAAQ